MRVQKEIFCDMCGSPGYERFLISGGQIEICEGCIELCWDVIQRRRADTPESTLIEPRLLLAPSIIQKSLPEPRPFRHPVQIDTTPRLATATIKPGFIYFVHAKLTNRIKIGWSMNPASRVAALQTGCPESLECIAIMYGRPGHERLLHEHFNGLRVHGEWFRYADELATYISETMK